MELFIEIKGGQGVGKTRALNAMKKGLEADGFITNWRHEESMLSAVPAEQVLADVELKRED